MPTPREKMESMIGDHSHKDCKNNHCPSYKKKEKSEHVFVVDSGIFSTKWGWKCMACGEFTKLYSV